MIRRVRVVVDWFMDVGRFVALGLTMDNMLLDDSLEIYMPPIYLGGRCYMAVNEGGKIFQKINK